MSPIGSCRATAKNGPLAVIYRDENTGEAFVFTMGLTPKTLYRLRGAHADGSVAVTHELIPMGPMAAAYLGKIAVATLRELTFTVTTAASSVPILKT